jgi:hypothetical protein
MWRDPIVEEIHAIRAQIYKEFDGDLRKYVDSVRGLTVADAQAQIAKRQSAAKKAKTKARSKATPKPRSPKAVKRVSKTPRKKSPRPRRAA